MDVNELLNQSRAGSPVYDRSPPQETADWRCAGGRAGSRHGRGGQLPRRDCVGKRNLRNYTSAVRFMAFADRSYPVGQDIQELSRFSCMLFLSVRAFLDYAGPRRQADSLQVRLPVGTIAPERLPGEADRTSAKTKRVQTPESAVNSSRMADQMIDKHSCDSSTRIPRSAPNQNQGDMQRQRQGT